MVDFEYSSTVLPIIIIIDSFGSLLRHMTTWKVGLNSSCYIVTRVTLELCHVHFWCGVIVIGFNLKQDNKTFTFQSMNCRINTLCFLEFSCYDRRMSIEEVLTEGNVWNLYLSKKAMFLLCSYHLNMNSMPIAWHDVLKKIFFRKHFS